MLSKKMISYIILENLILHHMDQFVFMGMMSRE